MMKNVLRFSLLLLVMYVSCDFAQETGQSQVLQRVIDLDGEHARPLDRVATILAAAQLKGGVEETRENCTNAEKVFEPFHGNVNEALNAVNTEGTQYRWKSDAVILVQNIGTRQTLLDTSIRRFAFTPAENPLTIEDRLFTLPEVMTKISELRLVHRDSELGFATAPKRQEAVSPAHVLEHMTMRDVLLAISTGHEDHLVWTYQEYNCDGKRYSQFNWRVR